MHTNVKMRSYDFFIFNVLILEFAVDALRCIGLLFQVSWMFASFS